MLEILIAYMGVAGVGQGGQGPLWVFKTLAKKLFS